jgi:drug/metabolite transporter (DMT)-like permease
MKMYYLFAGIAIFCWSTTATVVKLLLGSLNSWQVLFITSLFAGIFLLIVTVVTGKIKLLKQYRLRDYLITLGCCLPGTLLYYVFYYTATAKMLASQAFIVNYLWPIISVIFACILLKEKVTPIKLLGILLSFSGVVIAIGKDMISFDSNTLIGVLCCVLGAVSYGLFTALTRKSGYDMTVSLMLSYFATFLITGVMMLISGDLPSVDWKQMLGFVWNGAVANGLANVIWMLALDAKDTAKISNLAYITPFLSLIWTAIFLGEKITVLSVVGLVVIVSGVLIPLFYEKYKKSHPSATQVEETEYENP